MEFTYPVIPKNVIRSDGKVKNVKRYNSSLQSGRHSSFRNSNRGPRNVVCFAEKLIPLRRAFIEMSDKLHQFSAECNIDIIQPSLMSQYKILEKEYEIFCTQANVILSSIHPSTSITNSLVTSTNIKQANQVIKEWTELIKKFNSITSDGLMPHFQIISKEFGGLKTNVRDIVRLFSNSNLIPTVNPSLVRKIYSQIEEYKRFYFELYRKVEFHKPFTYNAENAIPGIQKLIKSIGTIFLYEFPSITMSTSEIMMKKNQVTYQCEYLLSLANGTSKFTELGNETIESFKKLNDHFKSLFDFLKIPFSLELTFNEEDPFVEEEEEEKEEVNETLEPDEITLKNKKAVDSMRKKIEDMTVTILNASSSKEKI